METEIAILTDHTAAYGYPAEWGRSVLLKTGDLRLLNDAGFTSTATNYRPGVSVRP